MASRTKSKAPESAENTVNTETQENSADEAPRTETESAPATPSAEVKADKPDYSAQLDAFAQTLGEVAGVAQEDGTFTEGTRGENGAISDDHMGLVVAAYRELRTDRKAKDAALKFVMDGLTAAVNAAHNDAARAFLAIRAELEKVAAPRATTTKQVDPTDAFIERYATVDLARTILFNLVPEGVAEDWQTKSDAFIEDLAKDGGDLTTYLGWMSADPETRGEEPKVHDVVKAAVKVAEGKAARRRVAGGSTGVSNREPFEGQRGDILDHIRNAFATGGEYAGGEKGGEVPVGGRLTVSQIQKIESATYEGRDPSAGAITSRLFKGNWDEAATGIRPDKDNSPAGAIRVA